MGYGPHGCLFFPNFHMQTDKYIECEQNKDSMVIMIEE